LKSVAAGKTRRISIDLAVSRDDVALVLEELTSGLRGDSYPVQLLQVAFKNSDLADDVVDHLTAKSVNERVASARTIGGLRMYDATSWLSPLLAARDRKVADAAARALGKIGGTQSAAALLKAIQRRGGQRRLVAELARSAPDLFVEVALDGPLRPGVRPALAIAAGLRRRRTATAPLIALLQRGSRRERAISCRALGWIGATTAIPALRAALYDPDWKVRISAS
jgi:HEAT repeat protein